MGRSTKAAFLLLLTTGGAGAAEMPWVKDWAAAQKSAESSGKLIMVDFYTDWCGWCKRLDRDTYSNEKVVKFAADLVPLKVNAEKEGAALQEQYKTLVSGYPTILFLDHTGAVIGLIDGYLAAEPFIEQVGKIRDTHKKFTQAQATLKQKPDDGEANAVLASVLSVSGKREEAEAAIRRAEAAKFTGDALGNAYNSVARMYVAEEKFDLALPLYIKADAVSKDVEVRALAKISITACHHSKGDLVSAKKVAQEVIDLKGAPEQYVKVARQVLQMP